MGPSLIIVGAVVGIALLVLLIWQLWGRSASAGNPRRGRQAYERQRDSLQSELLRRAAVSGKPRGLRWKHCEFESGLALARDQNSRQLLAFVGVTVSFEAIAGGPMEDVEAVGNLRAGTAVFTYARGRWVTDGRVLFNLDPQDAMRRYEGRIEPLEDGDA